MSEGNNMLKSLSHHRHHHPSGFLPLARIFSKMPQVVVEIISPASFWSSSVSCLLPWCPLCVPTVHLLSLSLGKCATCGYDSILVLMTSSSKRKSNQIKEAQIFK